MINILLPMAGASGYFDPKLYPYPISLTELAGKPMIERVVENLLEIPGECRFIFIVRSEDCRRFHLDNTLTLLSPQESQVIKLEGETKGALCTALMAISYIDSDDELVIANSDQLFHNVLPGALEELRESGANAGCLCFDSVHPRWSYVRIVDGRVIEAAEKKPISRNAIAGFYYFRAGREFVKSGMKTILNDASVEGRYFIAPAFNEIVLDGGHIHPVIIGNDAYKSFYTPQRIEEYSIKASAVTGAG
jgi:dTDP-glucose pyrophosphorylase